MRRTKPPVGWERAKNCFPVPNGLLDFDLPAGAVAVMDEITPRCDFVFTGGEPFANLKALQRMLDAIPTTH